MYGAIIGDLAGSVYEYEQTKGIKNIEINNLIEENAFYSDDTILTIAILDAILHNRNYEKYLKQYINKYEDYKPNFHPYFNTPFSPNLIKWSKSNTNGTSHGNGAMMRISPIGYMFDSEEDIIRNVYLATIPSHNSEEAISSATVVALIIYYLRKGLSRDEIFKKLDIKIKYTPFTKFNTTCFETIENSLYVLYYSISFEIVGSMAESLFGIDNDLINEANNKIPLEFQKILKKVYI